MPRRRYYRRQSDLCLQLALLQNNPQTQLLLVELAKELRAKANADGMAISTCEWIQETPCPAAGT